MTITATTPTGVIYQYRAQSWRDDHWMDIPSQEHLDLVKAYPEIYTVRAFYPVPMDALLRAPMATVSAALAVVDQARRDRDVIAGQLRRAMAALDGMP